MILLNGHRTIAVQIENPFGYVSQRVAACMSTKQIYELYYEFYRTVYDPNA